MSEPAIDMQPNEALLADNAEIMSRFASDGVPIEKICRVTFFCDFATTEAVHVFLKGLEGVRVAGEPRLALPMPKIDITEEADEGGELPILLSMDFEMAFDLSLVSQAEHVMQQLCDQVGGGDVSWEFPDPRNAPCEERTPNV